MKVFLIIIILSEFENPKIKDEFISIITMTKSSILMMITFKGCRLLHMMLCSRPPNKNSVRGDIFGNMARQIVDWIFAKGYHFQKNLGKCLGREIRNVVPLLLCQDKQSRESIAIIRTSVVKPLCLNVDKVVCSVAIWITEPSQVDSMVAYMGETTFCQKQHEVNVTNLDAIQQKRSKRQYDLMTLYDVYTTVFCSQSQNTMYYDGHDDDSYEEMTPEIRRIVVLLSLRGPVCCFALTDGLHQ